MSLANFRNTQIDKGFSLEPAGMGHRESQVDPC